MMFGISYSKFIDILNMLFLIAGIVFLFLGFAGVMIVILSYPEGIFSNDTFALGYGFINMFMVALGIFLILYHDKIIVKPEHYMP